MALSSSRSGRGGARNFASRRNFALTAAQVTNLQAAAAYARHIGLPLNRFITIHWKGAGVACESMVKATGRFLDMLTKTLARHGQSTAWIYVHENGHYEGWHCHLLVHVAPQMVEALKKRQLGWLRAITGQKYQTKSIKSEPVGMRLGVESSAPVRYAQNLDIVVAYMVKQATDNAARSFHPFEQRAPGLVVGKRAGTSQNLGVNARRSLQAA